ncbi:hypothetical protein F0562_031302 [Nyssa sinensis]|uniref:LysM domain-containing protein n=1 Tax=Nyssa sinensis TaxID=561372 RepID=A0A5J5ARS3_9ASTE|nr:hypothetical protein F0562_031302 [Nyssa sinensis]
MGAIANAASWYCAVVVLTLILFVAVNENSPSNETVRGNQFLERPCEEIYVVGEGETLNTISDKCGDPYIIEQNPHIHDPDDVYPGLVIKITLSQPRKLLGCSVGDDYLTDEPVRGNLLLNRPCDEIYVVGEGETLHTISDKCGDPYIVEQNPHIHDPDDVFPGLVIKITPSKPRDLAR